MTRRQYSQLAFTELVLYGMVVKDPESLMDPVLQKIDGVLDDEALVEQVLKALGARYGQSTRRGRYGTPAEVALRLLALKHLRGWSYQQLEWEVTGNLVYRRFCRIGAAKVPDAKTMVRLGQLIGGPTLRALFERIVAVAVERGVSRGRRMRIDTTVVEAPIHYPTDSGLCEDAVRVLRRQLVRLARAGVKLGFKLRDVKRSVGRRMREIGQALRLRGDKTRAALKKPYRRLLRVTGRFVRWGERGLVEAERQMRSLPRRTRAAAGRALLKLAAAVPLARQVVRQTRARIIRGITNSAEKLISLVEPYAQILRRGKLHKPTEFGMMVKVQEAEGGLVTDIGLVPGKADMPLLVPAAERHVEVFGRAPRLSATDRGFFSVEGERQLQAMGVRHVVLPKPGFRSKERIRHEQQRWFRRGRAWRVGGEARIARLKHQFGMVRSRYRGKVGMERTVVWAAIANNLVAVARGTA